MTTLPQTMHSGAALDQRGGGMASEDLQALARAVHLLEDPGFAARLTRIAGKPIELIRKALPASAADAIAVATTKGLELALKTALRTIGPPRPGSRLLHKALATASGAAGGAFGVASLAVELPISTVIMLRAIA